MSLDNAHSKSVYIETDGMTFGSLELACFFFNWINKFGVLQQSRDTLSHGEALGASSGQLDAARNVYAKIIRDAV
jgi:hypothetical protein